MKDYSVEYAHIYTNNKIDKEHETSLKVLRSYADKIKKVKGTISFVVLVDDYSFPDPTFSYDNFSKWLSGQGFAPDVIFRESQLIPLCDEVIKMIDDLKIKEPIVDYIKTKKYPCSLFVASWYLLRLGKIKTVTFPEQLAAEKLINILPVSFKPFEDKAFEIIASTKHSNVIEQIENHYIEGRIIA